MRLRAGCELVFEVEKETPLITMLRAQRTATQRILHESLRIAPHLDVHEYVDVFGNRCQRMTALPGELRCRVETLAEVAADIPVVDLTQPSRVPVPQLPDTALQFTLPSRYCPSDKLTRLGRELTRGASAGYGEVTALCAFVHDKLEYRYGVSNGSTCAEETLRAGAGVCRDFAHLGIALCRSIDIPARIAVGYLHQLEPMDLHAWFEAYVAGRWQTFDPTEETLRGGRIVLAHGRDAADVAFMTDYGDISLKTMSVTVQEAAQAADAQLAEAAE